MLGIRLTFLRNETRWLHDGTADWFWPAAEQANIPVMVHPRQQIDQMMRIAERHPGLRLIIDHMGLNHDIAQANLNAEVITETIRLGRFPKVSVKVSALPNYSLEPYPFRDLTPQIKRVYDAFGPHRCFWGTDLSHSYDRCDLPTAHHPHHRGARLPVRARQAPDPRRGDFGDARLARIPLPPCSVATLRVGWGEARQPVQRHPHEPFQM